MLPPELLALLPDDTDADRTLADLDNIDLLDIAFFGAYVMLHGSGRPLPPNVARKLQEQVASNPSRLYLSTLNLVHRSFSGADAVRHEDPAIENYYRQTRGLSIADFGSMASLAYEMLMMLYHFAYDGPALVDVSHIRPDHRIYGLVKLTGMHGWRLSQTEFDFLTLRDLAWEGVRVRTSAYEVVDPLMGETSDEIVTAAEALVGMTPEDSALAYAFTDKLLAEAAEAGNRPTIGMFHLDRVPLAYLDERLNYESIRLVIKPEMIYATFCAPGGVAIPAIWGPEDTSSWMYGDVLGHAISILLAGIWRDACVVKEKWLERDRPLQRKGSTKKYGREYGKRVYLPRTIYRARWGQKHERDRIARRRHDVDGFYRPLKMPRPQTEDEVERSHAAIERAELWGDTPPPTGYTYVAPHGRGRSEEQTQQDKADGPRQRKIICRGLSTVSTIFNQLKRKNREV